MLQAPLARSARATARLIESTESDEEMVIEDIEVEDEFDDIEVPFAVIEDVPIVEKFLLKKFRN